VYRCYALGRNYVLGFRVAVSLCANDLEENGHEEHQEAQRAQRRALCDTL